MSTTQGVKTLTMPAAGNLKDKLYHALTINADGRVEEADAATEIVAAIMFIDPNRDTANDDPVTVMSIAGGGIGLVKASAAIGKGHILVASAVAGKVAGVANIGALADDQMGFGVALEAAAAADQIIRFWAMPIGAPHAA